MQSIGITKIRLNNPMLATYVKAIESWDQNGEFYSKKKINNTDKEKSFALEVAERLDVSQENGYFYGIFYDDKFLGASKMEINPQKEVNVLMMINEGVRASQQIEETATRNLTIIAQAKYSNVGRINVKKIGTR